MMKLTTKRSLCLLICVVVLCSFIPTAVFATETDVGKILNDAYTLASGDVSTITGTGNIAGYYETVEFANNTNQGTECELVEIVRRSLQAPDLQQIVDDAFALAPNTSLPYIVTLKGTVVEIVDPYTDMYRNLTVIIEVESTSGPKNIECYRLKGEGAENIKVGSIITVTGVIKHYYRDTFDESPAISKIEFDSGCTFEFCVTIPSDPKQIVDDAFALAKNESLPYTATLTGKVTEIVDPYNDEYLNITIKIEVEGTKGKKIITCFRLSGNGADKIAIGDTITVTGKINRYYKEATADSPNSIDMIEFVYPKLLSRQPFSNNTSVTGLVKQYGTWYYLKNGKIATDTTSLVKWNNSWWYVVKGKLAASTTGLVKWNGGWWYVVNGKVASNTTTLVKYNNEWWYVVNGKIASSTTSLVKYNNEWWYVVKGKIASGTTSLVKYNNEWWYVVKGKIAGNTTTLINYNGGWYYIVKGKLAAKTTTLFKHHGTWYYVENGKVNFTKTGLFKYNGKWYYIEKGVIR